MIAAPAVVQAPEESVAPAPKKVEKPYDTDQRVNAQLQKDLAANGVQAPSDITKALIESSDG